MSNKCAKLNLSSLGSALHCVCFVTLVSLCVNFMSHCDPFCVNLWSSFLDRFRPSLHSYFNPIMVTLNMIICGYFAYTIVFSLTIVRVLHAHVSERELILYPFVDKVSRSSTQDRSLWCMLPHQC